MVRLLEIFARHLASCSDALLLHSPQHLPPAIDAAGTTPFVIALTERPWDLPAGLLRADVIEAVWHLDLPDVKERAETWDLAAKRHGHESPGFDNVILARASHEFTPAEIHEAYRRGARASHPKPPKEPQIFDALIQLQSLVEARKEDMLRQTYWTHRCTMKAHAL